MRKRFSFGSSASSTTSVNATTTTTTTTSTSTSTNRSSTTTTTTNHPPQSSVAPSPLVPTTFSDNLPLPSVFVFDLDYTLWPFWVDTHCSPPLKPIAVSPSSAEVSKLRDRHGEDFGFYTTVPPILWAARQRGITMTIASRTHAPQLADAMLRSLTISPPPPPPPSLSGTGTGPKTTTPSMPPNAFFNNNNSSSSSRDHYHYNNYDESRSRGSARKPIKAITLFTAPQIYPGSKVTHLKKIQTLVAPSSTSSSSSAGVRRSLIPSSSSPSPSPSISSTTTSTSKKRRSMIILGGGGRKNKQDEKDEKDQQQQDNKNNINNNNNSKNDNKKGSGKAVVPFEDMIFFDDEARNGNVETELGVTFVLVRDGLSRDEVDRGVWEWRRRRLGIVQAQGQGQGQEKGERKGMQEGSSSSSSRNTKDASQVEAGKGAAVNGFVEMEG